MSIAEKKIKSTTQSFKISSVLCCSTLYSCTHNLAHLSFYFVSFYELYRVTTAV